MRLNPGLPELTTPIDGTTLHSVCQGSGDAVLLVHGSLCDYRYWTPQLRSLSPTHAVHAVSLRHCWPNPSPVPRPETPIDRSYSIEHHANDLVAWLAQHAGAPMHLVGHSRGARVALDVALRAPHAIRSLTLADVVLPDAEAAPGRSYVAEAAAAIQRGDIEAGLSRFVDAVNGGNTWRRMIPDFRQMALDNAGTLVLQAAETLTLPDPAAVQALTMPLLLIGGSHSPERYARSRQHLQRWRPDARTVVIAGAAHGMNLARPQAFRDALLDFWNAQC